MRKIQMGKYGAARMTPAQKVTDREEAFPLSIRRRAVLPTVRAGLRV